jgi:hypothetical protein
VVERGVARLDDEPVAVARRHGFDDIRPEPLARLVHEPVAVAVPDSPVVVRVDDRDPALVRAGDDRRQRVQPLAKGGEQLAALLMAEVVDDVDEEECVVQRLRRSPASTSANE